MADTTSLVPAQHTALVPHNPLAQWTPEQIKAIKSVICPGINDDELVIFANTCERTGLDPFTSPPQIYAIIRKQKNSDGGWDRRLNIQTAINGFRSIGESTGEYEGQEGPYWCGPDGKWVEVWLKPEPPAAAKVAIYRRGFKPMWGVATFKSFVQQSPLWNKMPDHMLAICAERVAWTKTFPRKCSGIYIPEEMPPEEPERAPEAHRKDSPVTALPPAPSAGAPEPANVVDAAPTPPAKPSTRPAPEKPAQPTIDERKAALKKRYEDEQGMVGAAAWNQLVLVATEKSAESLAQGLTHADLDTVAARLDLLKRSMEKAEGKRNAAPAPKAGAA